MTTPAVTPHFISENCLFPQPEHAGGVEHGRPRLAQRRTPQPALLTAQARFGGCGNFLQIKSLVEEVAGDIMGIGPMAIYDTGLYIGANLGLLPEEVWMHAGAREGALENGASCRARLLPLSAFAQGKFWEMHDTLFARQDALDDADLLKYAAELSLDSDRVSRELARHEYARRVEEDQQSGLDSGVSGTLRPSTSMAPGTTVPPRSATCSPRSGSCAPISSLATKRPPTQEFPAPDGPVRSGPWPGEEIDHDRQPTPAEKDS